MEVTQVLLNAQSVDGNLRKHAEETLNQFQSQNFPCFFLSLSGELSNDEKPVDSRWLAGLILKYSLDAIEPFWKAFFAQRWLSLDASVKAEIRTCMLRTLTSSTIVARSTASQVIAKIAGIELRYKQRNELVKTLTSSNILGLPQPVPNHVKQVSLETLGYLCEEISPELLDQDEVDLILIAVVRGMNATGNDDIRLAATQALYSALSFARTNFENDFEQDYIMRAVCEAAVSPVVKIRQSAFECLVSVSSMYYDKLAPYMQDVFNITAKTVKEDEETLIVIWALEFWNSICGVEINSLYNHAIAIGDSDAPPCFYFIEHFLPVLVPLVLESMLKQEEDQDQEEGAWGVSMAGGVCLGWIAQTVGDAIIPLVMPFVEDNISKPQWRQRDAAALAFGFILWGPSPGKLIPLVDVGLHLMLRALKDDENTRVRFTCSWTLARIFEFLPGSIMASPKVIITASNFPNILSVLIDGLKDLPTVAENVCFSLYRLVRDYGAVVLSSFSTPFFQSIIEVLLSTCHREDAGETWLRTFAYQTLYEIVRCLTEETVAPVMQLIPFFLTKLKETQKLSSEDEREEGNELQGTLCGCLHLLIKNLCWPESAKHCLTQHTDQMMELFLRVSTCGNATKLHRRAMLAIGAVAYASGPDFAKYMQEVYPCLVTGLKNFEDYEACSATVDVVLSICMALGPKVYPFSDGIIDQLLKNLYNDQLHPYVKPQIFTCFGAMAFAIGERFDEYLAYAMPMIQAAAFLSLSAVNASDEMTGHARQLRLGVLNAYSGIFEGIKSSWKIHLLMPSARYVLQLLGSLYQKSDMDQALTRAAIDVLGRLVNTLGIPGAALLRRESFCKDLTNECLSSNDPFIKEAAEYLQSAVYHNLICVFLPRRGRGETQ